jgi:WD40 repeat protein
MDACRVYSFRLQKSPMPSTIASKKTTGSKDGNGNGPVARVEEQRATLVEEEVGGRKGVRAHMDRITALVYHKNFLYSVSRDGSIRMWDATSMTLVAEVKHAHGGKPISCVVIGPDNFLYTGGNDNVGA